MSKIETNMHSRTSIFHGKNEAIAIITFVGYCEDKYLVTVIEHTCDGIAYSIIFAFDTHSEANDKFIEKKQEFDNKPFYTWQVQDAK